MSGWARWAFAWAWAAGSRSGGEACTPINFDPNVMSAGFSAGNDPILRMRSPVYAVSFGQRLSGQ